MRRFRTVLDQSGMNPCTAAVHRRRAPWWNRRSVRPRTALTRESPCRPLISVDTTRIARSRVTDARRAGRRSRSGRPNSRAFEADPLPTRAMRAQRDPVRESHASVPGEWHRDVPGPSASRRVPQAEGSDRALGAGSKGDGNVEPLGSLRVVALGAHPARFPMASLERRAARA